MEDAQLLEEAMGGRKDSLRLLLENYYKAATAVAFATCGVVDWAREGAAAGLAAIGTSPGTIEQPQEFGRHLVQSVRSESERLLEGKIKPSSTPGSVKAKIEQALKIAEKTENVSPEKLNELVLSAFSALPDRSRETLALFCHYSDSYSELERILGISRQELGTHLGQAKKELADILTPLCAQQGELEKLFREGLKGLRLEEGLSSRVGEILAQAHTRISRKSPVKAGLVVSCALGAAIIILLVLLALKGKPDVPYDGIAERVIDSAEIRYFGKSKWLPFERGDRVVLGSSIRTGSGKCALLLGGKVRVILASNTVCDFCYFKELQKVILCEGEIFVQSPEGEVQVDAGESKMFGKGCDFDVKVAPDGQVDVLTVKGKVAFFNSAGSIELESGKGGTLKAGAHPEELKESDVEKKTAWALQFLQ
jgi:DNA-directed RNA polymerase specialized sigma24 family protein